MERKAPSWEELIRMRIVFSVPGMDAVAVRRGLEYKRGDIEPLYMDLYSPAGPPALRPAVILIHGGPIPLIGARNMGVFQSYGELLAASGFVAVTFDHRFLAPSRITDAAQDVSDLLTHVRVNAGTLGIDPQRLALWAFSGGGPFLAAPLRERPAWLCAVVAYYAALDLAEPRPDSPFDIRDDLRRAFSAVSSLGEDARSVPPLLVARAGLDHPSLNEGIDRFVQTAVTGGATLNVLNHPGGRHGFDVLDDDARSKQIIRNTVQFLRDYLAP
jgi:acetyl esterase/lipase